MHGWQRPLGLVSQDQLISTSVAAATTPETKSYMETGTNCGTITGGELVPCKTWTYSELAQAFPKGGMVRSGRQDIWYYPTPQAVVDRLGLCTVLHSIVEKGGLLVPWKWGPMFIEPGLFHPGKSWSQMIDESASLRAGAKAGYKAPWTACAQESAADLLSHQPGSLTTKAGHIFINVYTLDDVNGNTLCDEVTEGRGHRSFRMPVPYDTNPFVVATAARWLQSDNKTTTRGQDHIFCENAQPKRMERDPQWGHMFGVQDVLVQRVGPDGPDQGPSTTSVEDPIIQYYIEPNTGGAKVVAGAFAVLVVGATTKSFTLASLSPLATNALIDDIAEGQWSGLLRDQVRQLMVKGKWPIPGVSRVRWVDTGAEFNAATLPTPTTKAPGGGTVQAGVLAGLGIATVVAVLAYKAWEARQGGTEAAAPPETTP